MAFYIGSVSVCDGGGGDVCVCVSERAHHPVVVVALRSMLLTLINNANNNKLFGHIVYPGCCVAQIDSTQSVVAVAVVIIAFVFVALMLQSSQFANKTHNCMGIICVLAKLSFVTHTRALLNSDTLGCECAMANCSVTVHTPGERALRLCFKLATLL